MKLFQRLLVAPAALGLLAPLASNASDVNLNEISKYSDSESVEFANSFNNTSKGSTLIAGGEGMIHDHDSDSFSSTTTASFSADMAIGAVDGASSEALTAIYGFQIDLNTSFTGEDSFDVSLDAGSGAATLGELDLNSTSSDALTVDGVSYTFPIGDKTTVFFGDSMDGSTLYNTACVYGGHTVKLDDCGNSGAAMAQSYGTAAGASYDFGNGFTAALGYEGQGSTTSGLFTKEGTDVFGGQVTYTGDSYGVSLTYSDLETSSSDYTYTAINAYYTPESAGSLPSISAGYESGETSTSGYADTSQWMVGLQWDEVGAGTLGAALGTYGHIADNATEYYMYEAFYSYPMNDGMTLTPIVFIKETSGNDETGVMVKTSFSF
tara:strand:+ start:107 stop:1243 length:1137 start_codon:yes stop_codon:yes gene_type:complete